MADVPARRSTDAPREPQSTHRRLPADNGGSRPVPDPTELTTDQLYRAINAERDFVLGQLAIRDERLEGIDRATELRLTGIVNIPAMIDEKVQQLSLLMRERFDSIAKQFDERDTRSERESRDNKVAVDAAFAAQKEAAAKQDESNLKAIDKSERATAETINKLAELFKSSTDALSDKIDDGKERDNALEQRINGIEQRREGGQLVRQNVTVGAQVGIAALGLLVAALGVALIVILAGS